MPALTDALADLLIRYDDAKAAGRPATPQQLCRDTPDLIGPFTQLLKRLGRVDPVFDGAALASQSNAVEVIDAGRFDPLSFHDEGGLGVVYLAEDAELRRPVALKWMKPLPGLDPAARRRFVLEAEITGKLEHPGIAPVYGAGHDPHGRPYYAMRFIHGVTFGNAIERYHALPETDPNRPVEFTRLLRAFVSVCQTVAYAHARGVIHRDLKPGNVMLGPYGETLVVDWGLAKRYDRADADETADAGYGPVELKLAGGEGGTVYGQVKGSPAYMAPEQARGEVDRVGPASDVYALGATLYALLAGRAPYSGPTAAAVVDQVKRGAPSPPRKVASGVPRPLDAVCGKAMARNEGDRYATPLELAADVERWLADEPLSAYRDPLLTRGRRWVKRHRTGVATLLAALLVVGLALAVVTPLLAAKNRELAGRTQALERANVELEKANSELVRSYSEVESGFDDATDTLAKATATLSDKSCPGVTITAEDMTDWFRQYRVYLDRFVVRYDGNPRMAKKVAAALLKCFELAHVEEKREDSEKALASASERFAALVRADRADRDARFGNALCDAYRGEAAWKAGQFATGRRLLEQARAELEALTADPTPINLAQFTSDPTGLLKDSPAVRLANLSLLMTNEFPAVDEYARAGDRARAGDDALAATYRGWLATARARLTGGKPVPDTAPFYTKVLALSLESRELSMPNPTADELKRIRAVRERAEALSKLNDGLPDLSNLLGTADHRLAAAALRAGDRAEAVGHLKNVFATADKLYEMWRLNDPFRIRDLTLIRRTMAAEMIADLSDEIAGGERVPERADAARKDALSSRIDQDAGLRLISELPGLTLGETRDAVGMCLRSGRRSILSPKTLAEAERMFGYAIKLLRAQLARRPDALGFELAVGLAEAQTAWVYARLQQGRPYRDTLAELDASLARLAAERPDDPGLLVAGGARKLVEATRVAVEREDFEAALALLADGEAKYDEATRRGYPPADSANVRSGLALMKGWFMGGLADKLLTANPADGPRAAAVLDKALAILAPLAEAKPNPLLPADELRRRTLLAAFAGELIADLKALRTRATGKK